MKKLVVALLSFSGLLTGCIGIEPIGYGTTGYGTYYDYGNTYQGDRGYSYNRDRDGDGVPNRRDARPDNPRRY